MTRTTILLCYGIQYHLYNTAVRDREKRGQHTQEAPPIHPKVRVYVL